jgi:hypothetical protein|tara:strand:+ start:513 stop:764 length:252 start_codon:yes stop_codon:yes gene_type:complete
MTTKPKAVIPFLFYVKDGVCKSSRQMPASGEAYEGWLSATHIIRNQHKHTNEHVEISLKALRKLLAKLTDEDEIREKDLLQYV